MRIGGFQPFTLSDFPGCVAAIVFSQGCNFRCSYCHNEGLLCSTPDKGALIPQEEVLGYLDQRSGRVKGVVVTGGEPTLQPDLPLFLLRLRSMGLKVKLDTNGSNPQMLSQILLEGLVDYVAMDVKAPWDAYGRVTGVACDVEAIRQSMRLVQCSGVEHEFRTTRVTPLLSSGDMDRISDQIPEGSFHRLQTFRPELALNPDLATMAAAG